MTKSALRRWLLCLTAAGMLAPAASAQTDVKGHDGKASERYLRFEIPADSEDMLKERLGVEQKLGPLKDLIKQIASDPSRLSLLQKMKDIKLDDPELKKAVQEWAAHDPKFKQDLDNLRKLLPRDRQSEQLQDLQKQLDTILKSAKKETLPKDDGPVSAPKPAEPIKTKEDPLDNWMKSAMKQAEETKVGDWLRDSPAWRRAFMEMQDSLRNPQPGQGNLNDWGEKLGVSGEMIQQMVERLRNMPRPGMDRWDWNFRLPALGRLPKVRGHGMPKVSNPSLPAMGMAFTWLLVVVVFMLVCWHLLRWAGGSKKADDERAALGPWPIKPEAVATRAELVRAFDYLALWSLGKRVQSWNHQAIVRRWQRESPNCAASAAALSLLYEKARYTDGTDELPTAERDMARQSLRQLAGAF